MPWHIERPYISTIFISGASSFSISLFMIPSLKPHISLPSPFEASWGPQEMSQGRVFAHATANPGAKRVILTDGPEVGHLDVRMLYVYIYIHTCSP